MRKGTIQGDQTVSLDVSLEFKLPYHVLLIMVKIPMTLLSIVLSVPLFVAVIEAINAISQTCLSYYKLHSCYW